MLRMTSGVRAVASSAIAAAAAAIVVIAAPLPISATGPTLLVPVMFVLAGLLGPIWRGSAFTCAAVAGIGVLHLVALAASALALGGFGVEGGTGPSVAWHVASQVLFVAGFGLLVPLAAGYPDGPAPPWSLGVLGVGALVPLLASVAGPTPAVLDGATPLGPFAGLLPEWFATASAAVFLLPAASVVVGLVRLVRGDRVLRRRLAWPLVSLAAMAGVVALGAVLQDTAEGLTTALFLVSSPLVPVGLIAGSRVDRGADADADARRLRRELQAIAARLDAASRGLPGGPQGAGSSSPEPAAPLGTSAAADDRSDVARSASSASDPRLDRLTDRETAVLALIAAGRSNPAIAGELHVSLSAVEKHVNAIFQKLDLLPGPDTHRRVAASLAYLRERR
ncbi:response regulator transcription factor [Agromyces sp. GXS1127]|uniref:helix-turn-helix transcriptional regulator n=1 Tax=Agromyces sp. GXS1127 TaxID=3424181 RepID=UPI003D31026F